jgi:hypothetical protein
MSLFTSLTCPSSLDISNENHHPNSPSSKPGNSKGSFVEEDAVESPRKIGIKDRYNFALKQLERKQSERTQNLRHDPSVEVETKNKRWSAAIRDLRSKQATDIKKVQVLSKVDSFTVAKTRIEQWEDQVATAPTAKQVAILWCQVRAFQQASLDLQEAFLSKATDDEGETPVMLLGAVKVMRYQSADPFVLDFLSKSLSPLQRYVGLATQVLPRTSHITLTAIASILKNGDYALFLLAQSMVGYEHEDPSNVGLHSFTLLSSVDQTSVDQSKRLKLLQVAVDLEDRKQYPPHLLREIPFLERMNQGYQRESIDCGEKILFVDSDGFDFADVYEDEVVEPTKEYGGW